VALPAAQLATPPPFVPRPGGLLDAAIGPADMDPHVASQGAQWLNEVCGFGHLYPAACQAPPYPARVVDAGGSMVTVYPFVTYASYICPPVGTPDSDAERRVRLRFQLSEHELVERAFWGGNAAEGVTGVLEQMVAAGSATELAVSASIPEAVSLLEQQAATVHYSGPLLLHARPRMAAYMSSKGVIRGPLASDNGRWQTHYASTVVFGPGYQGNKPDGTVPSATAENIYITGRVFVWRDPQIAVSPPDQMLITGTGSGGTNQRVMYASRAYAIGVECLAATTLVTRAG
jgi:hypothetical protein